MQGNQKESNTTNGFTGVLFIAYLVVLFWILLFKFGVRFSSMGGRHVNLVPFKNTLISQGKPDAETILNVVIFIPLGIYAGLLFKRWYFIGKLFFCFLISLMIEDLQLKLRVGVFDITDIITNTLGGFIGLILFIIIEKLFNDNKRAQKFINIFAGLGTVVMISFLILLRMHRLSIRYQ